MTFLRSQKILPPLEVGDAGSTNLAEWIVDFTISNNLPLSFCEKPGFRAFVNKLLRIDKKPAVSCGHRALRVDDRRGTYK